MQKEARELKDFIARRVLARYPLVSFDFRETAGHHVKIVLGAPNGRSETLFCTAGGDPTTRLNVERDVKGALRKLNIALQGEDRTMASISTKNHANGKAKTVHSFRDLPKAHDLNAEIDTAPREAKLQVNGNAFHVNENGRRVRDFTEAQRLFDEGKTHKEIHKLTGIPLGSLGGRLVRHAVKAEPVKEAPQSPAPKVRASPRRKTQENVFKISMHLSAHCSLVDELAVYEENWSDAIIAATVGNGCEAEDVKELRIKHLGRMAAEIPKSHLEPDVRAMFRRIQKLEAEVGLLKGLAERVQLIEDVVTKP